MSLLKDMTIESIRRLPEDATDLKSIRYMLEDIKLSEDELEELNMTRKESGRSLDDIMRELEIEKEKGSKIALDDMRIKLKMAIYCDYGNIKCPTCESLDLCIKYIGKRGTEGEEEIVFQCNQCITRFTVILKDNKFDIIDIERIDKDCPKYKLMEKEL